MILSFNFETNYEIFKAMFTSLVVSASFSLANVFVRPRVYGPFIFVFSHVL